MISLLEFFKADPLLVVQVDSTSGPLPLIDVAVAVPIEPVENLFARIATESPQDWTDRMPDFFHCTSNFLVAHYKFLSHGIIVLAVDLVIAIAV